MQNERVLSVTCKAFHVSEKGFFTSHLHLVPRRHLSWQILQHVWEGAKALNFPNLLRLRSCPTWGFTLPTPFRCNPWPDMTRHLLMWSGEPQILMVKYLEPVLLRNHRWWIHDIHIKSLTHFPFSQLLPLLVYSHIVNQVKTLPGEVWQLEMVAVQPAPPWRCISTNS